jgi:hypothetical protein
MMPSMAWSFQSFDTEFSRRTIISREYVQSRMTLKRALVHVLEDRFRGAMDAWVLSYSSFWCLQLGLLFIYIIEGDTYEARNTHYCGRDAGCGDHVHLSSLSFDNRTITPPRSPPAPPTHLHLYQDT